MSADRQDRLCQDTAIKILLTIARRGNNDDACITRLPRGEPNGKRSSRQGTNGALNESHRRGPRDTPFVCCSISKIEPAGKVAAADVIAAATRGPS